MCTTRYKIMRLFWLNVEKGSLIFAILSLIIITGLLVFGCVQISNIDHTPPSSTNVVAVFFISVRDAALELSLIIFITILVVNLLFTIVLTTGLVKKIAACILTYFVFGIAQNVIGFIFVIMLMIDSEWTASIIMLLGIFVYSLILAMICLTYKKILKGYALTNISHQQLVESRDV